MAIYLAKKKLGEVRRFKGLNPLQWKCDNIKRLKYEFSEAYVDDISPVIEGLDTSKVNDFSYMFVYSSVKSLNLLHFNTSSAIYMQNMFNQCDRLTALDLSNFNTEKVTNMSNMFNYCSTLQSLDISNFKTNKVTNMSSMFRNCKKLTKISNIDLYSVTNNGSMFDSCAALEDLKVYNVRRSLTIGSGTSYGTKLTLESLINTLKELWDYSSGTTTYTLTMSTASKELISDVYVKLVDVTDEMLAADPYADQKMPCVVCESTDDGAMLITDYATAKNWTIA